MNHILLVDDHPLVMEGTRMILELEGDMQVSLANTAGQALEQVRARQYDVMLLDLHIGETNGIDLAKQILSIAPYAILLIYTGFEFNNHFNLMIEAGISGFILKTTSSEQLVNAIRCALRGETILPLSLVKQLRRTALQPPSSNGGQTAAAISNEEYEILQQIAKGRSNKEIAGTVLMSQRSLEYCLTGLFHKLNVKSRMEAVLKAKQMGFLTE